MADNKNAREISLIKSKNFSYKDINFFDLEKSILEKFLYSMLLIRSCEYKIAEAKKEGLIKGPVHLGVGQEAIAVGIAHNLIKTDRVFGAHRSHSHILSMNHNIHGLFAEVLGKVSGFSKGMGGSMHLSDPEKGFYGSVPIVTGTVPLALGAGLAAKLQKSGDIAVAYLGDGATEEGVFHESLNFAKISNIPILFVVENNLFSSHMHISLRQPEETIIRFAEANNIKCKIINGNDVNSIYRTSSLFIKEMRKRPEPFLIEAITYRWFGHVDWREDIDVGISRSKNDIANWKKRDPIKLLKEAMIHNSFWSITEQESLEDKIQKEITSAWSKAMNDPYPSKDDLLRNVYK
tara:strand:+ start:13046 stop:14092 length:1047 start_codon:yes stop_codon:yes gene_type:complete